MDEIYAKGLDPNTNKYVIPDELFMSAELIETQLKLLEKLFPKAGSSSSESSKTTSKTEESDMNSSGQRLDTGTTKVRTILAHTF